MPRARRRRDAVAIALSVGFHLAVLAVLAVQAPVLRIPPEESGPPQPIIPVLLMPRVPPRASPSARPEPIRLHRRPQPFAAPPIPPLPAPPAPESRPAPPGPVAIHPAPLPESPKADVRAALRSSPVGCANPDAVGLNKAEREYCNELLGKGAKTAPLLGLGLARDKQAEFDKDAAHKDACRAYRAAPGPGAFPGLRNGAC
jgi:hypothetical protein